MESNVIVMSEAGKPIFFRHGKEEEVSRLCGLFQAIRASVNGNVMAFGLGEIQTLHSGELCIVFMTVGSITLVAMSRSKESGAEVYMRMRLEYVFATIIFTLTEQVQNVFDHNASFDLRSMLHSNDGLLHGILDESEPNGDVGRFLSSGVKSFFPLSHSVRESASRALQSVGSRLENTAFALLVVGDRLVSLVQSAFRSHQLRASDILLILNFLGRQPGLETSELWIPMCLPRFNSSGFLYAYTKCLDSATKLSLILISSFNTTEQFQLFRDAAAKIREVLGMPEESGSVLRIRTSGKASSGGNGVDGDVEWHRSSADESMDEDYVDISADGERIIRFETGECILLEELKRSKDSEMIATILQECVDEGSVIHFLFRMDVQVKKSSKQSTAPKGTLSQCICPKVPFPFIGDSAKHRLWSCYHKLAVRLRLGSASVESTMDAFDMISRDETEDRERSFPVITKHCPTIGLLEAPPNNEHGMTYILDGSETFLAMNGRDFEL